MSGSESESEVNFSKGHAGGQRYYIEKLVSKRILMSGDVEYEAKWWGWEWNHNTWESRDTLLEDCPNLIDEFENATKGKKAGEQSGQEQERRNPILTVNLDDDDDEEDEEQRQPRADKAKALGKHGTSAMKQESGSGVSGGGAKSKSLGNNRSPKRQAPFGEQKKTMKKAKTSGETSTSVVHLKGPSMPVKKINKKRSPKSRKSRKTPAQVSAGKPKLPKYVAERILGVTQDKGTGELLFLIKWKDMDVANLVPASRANIGCPQVVIKFYESKLVWRPDRMEVDSDSDEESEESDKDSEDGNQSDFDWKIVG